MPDTTSDELASSKTAILQRFVRVHNDLKAAGGVLDEFVVDSLMEREEDLQTGLELFTRFHEAVGEGVFKAKVSSAMRGWIGKIFDAAVKVHGARGEALDTVADKDYLATLVVEPSWEELAKDFIVGETGCPTEETLKEFSYSQSLALLQGFVDHVGIERLHIPFARDAKGNDSMEASHAMAYLQMLTGVRDLAFAASVVQKALLTKSLETEGPVKLELMKSSLVDVIKIMQKKLVSLDELLEHLASLHIEREGWQMHTT